MPRRGIFGISAISALVIVATGIVALRAWTDARGSQDHPTASQLIEAIGPQLEDEQQALIADGVLTLDEYEGAIQRLAKCYEGEGLSVVRNPGKGVGGVTELMVQGDLRTVTVEQYPAIQGDCIERHTEKLGVIWAEQNRPTTAQLEDQEARFNACLVDRGMAHVVGRFHEVTSNPVNGPFPQGTPEWDALFDCHEETRGYR